uniref:Uncharacterized protein n=1 Tax=Pararge aegeria TaxID=116150 RepID=S4PYQ3_9NEOP
MSALDWLVTQRGALPVVVVVLYTTDCSSQLSTEISPGAEEKEEPDANIMNCLLFCWYTSEFISLIHDSILY